MKSALPWLLIVPLWALPAKSATAQPWQCPGLAQRHGIVFVVNGSGDFTTLTDSLCEIIEARCLPLAVHTIRWCRWAQAGRDHRDFGAQMVAGQRLARCVASHRQLYPQEKIILIGHSAGTHVILAATCLLAPGSVDRIVLLAPSVSQHHDLRPGLRCSRGGIDCLWSERDNTAALGSDLFGNADRLPGKPAGEAGFSILPLSVPDSHLYRSLRQYAWNPCWEATGHSGGHYGFTCVGFLDACVMPLMLAP